eukprot:TRINITY_DN42699_c0_g2_i1.p3 TRINITY_DN42699_c0_g2~~TRINITY_DN42699_c0_g2_i1.p3  ORF type:complete len:108 (-),score=9.54 TRINITY_DN42699_c0_g2_i1:179-502(-)
MFTTAAAASGSTTGIVSCQLLQMSLPCGCRGELAGHFQDIVDSAPDQSTRRSIRRQSDRPDYVVPLPLLSQCFLPGFIRRPEAGHCWQGKVQLVLYSPTLLDSCRFS